MAVWRPPSKIGEKELVGRRLLDKHGVERETGEDGRPLLEVGDFYETRVEDDLSFDRLGDPNPSQDTLRAITRIADKHAALPEVNRVFKGWATIRVKDFGFTGWVANITATPRNGEDGPVANRWHADVSREGFREKAHAYSLAAVLQHTFTRKGGYEAPRR